MNVCEQKMAAAKYDFFFLKQAFLKEHDGKNLKKTKAAPPQKPCGKIIFHSQKEASATANKLQKRSGTLIKNVYFCKKCQGWHFSKMGKQDFKGE